MREYLEVWSGQLYPEDWTRRIDAIEVFEPYTRLPWYKLFYDNVYVGDIREQLDLLPEYDLVLFGDVIEHMEKEEGQSVLSRCRRWILTTPGYDSPQGAAFGNEHERHVSRWNAEDVADVVETNEKILIAWGEQ